MDTFLQPFDGKKKQFYGEGMFDASMFRILTPDFYTFLGNLFISIKSWAHEEDLYPTFMFQHPTLLSPRKRDKFFSFHLIRMLRNKVTNFIKMGSSQPRHP